MKYFFVLIFFCSLAFSYGSYQINQRLKTITDYTSMANRYVRENNFEASLFYFNKAVAELDSIQNRALDQSLFGQIDSLESELSAHISNFERILDILDYNLYSERVLAYRFKDLNIPGDNLLALDYKDIDTTSNRRIKKYLKYYTKRARKTTKKYIDRSEKYLPIIKKIVKSYNLPQELAYLPFIESGFYLYAHSPAKATGLWQFIPSTAKKYELEKNWWIDERRDIIKATSSACRLLQNLYQHYNDWNLALAAYNCGERGLDRAIRRSKTKNFWKLRHLPRETRNYIPRFLAFVKIYQNRKKYGFFESYSQKCHFDTIQVDSCINLAYIAQKAGTTYEKIKILNPEIRQWTLPANTKNYPLIIPAENKLIYNMNKSKEIAAAKYASTKIANSKKYKLIADKYYLPKKILLELNEVKSFKELNKKDSLIVLEPPVKEKFFKDFNNNYLSSYENEKYYFIGRKNINYRVKNGDSLWSISRKFKVNLRKLKSWNNIGRRNIIKPGQRITIYL